MGFEIWFSAKAMWTERLTKCLLKINDEVHSNGIVGSFRWQDGTVLLSLSLSSLFKICLS